MKTAVKKSCYILLMVVITQASLGQGMQMGEVLIMNYPVLKEDVPKEALRRYIHQDIAPAWNDRKQRVGFHLFEADRGKGKGEYLLVCRLNKIADRKASLPAGSPFSDDVLLSGNSKKASDLLDNPNDFTEYHLLGADEFESLPHIDILGIHYLKVKNTRTTDFEKFVVEKMHPSVGNLLPNMHLLTYKAVAGDAKGNYITIFAIESTEARDEYWPVGMPETERLTQAFRPLKNLALELSDYLVSGSYLEPSGGAAAIFESKEWTDFIFQPQGKEQK
ncbi:MAG: hypothetical protein WEB30_19620 [Cyclobacteriaceae bacterium]